MIFSVLAFAGLVKAGLPFNCDGEGGIQLPDAAEGIPSGCTCKKTGTDCSGGLSACDGGNDWPYVMTCDSGKKKYRSVFEEPCKRKGNPVECTCLDGTVVTGSDCSGHNDPDFNTNADPDFNPVDPVYKLTGCQEAGGCSTPQWCTCSQGNNWKWAYGCGKFKGTYTSADDNSCIDDYLSGNQLQG